MVSNSDEAPETLASEIRRRHRLTTFHIFSQGDGWRVFGFRKDPKGYQASVEQGCGNNIAEALNDLDENLSAGPVAAAKKRQP